MEGDYLPICMCCIPDVDKDFLPWNTRNGATIPYTTVDEIRETRTLKHLLSRS